MQRKVVPNPRCQRSPSCGTWAGGSSPLLQPWVGLHPCDVPPLKHPGAEQSLVWLPLPSRHVASGAGGSLLAPSTRCLQPPAAEVLPGPGTVLPAGPARERGVESGDGAEAKAESEESEAVEDASHPRLQVSEQKSRPWREVRGCPCSGFRQRLQQKQAARACQCSPWWVASSLSAPEGQLQVRGRLFPPPCAKTHPPHRAAGLWLRSPPSPRPACPGREAPLCSAPGSRGDGGNTDGVPAGLAGLGEEALEAAAAAGPAALHHVALPAQGHVALQAAEVLQVPAPALRLDALLHEDQLEGGKTTHPLNTQLENR